MQVNMITLKDLKEYDVKNIDAAKLMKTLQQRTDIVINIALVVITLMTVNNILTKNRVKSRDLTQKISLLEKKIKAIENYEKSKKNLVGFVKSLPQGLPEADSIIQKVNALAVDRGLQISSFAPGDRTENVIYKQVSLRLNVASHEYSKLVLLTKDIERAPFNLRIQSWSAKMEPKRRKLTKLPKGLNADIEPSIINSELELSSISFQNEK